MKFIHIADVHWGITPDSDKPWGKERAQAVKDTFSSIIRQSLEQEADCLLISGDLFHRQPIARDLKEINYLFSTIPSVRVIIIAGNHDRIQSNSLLLSFNWASNVTFLMDEDWSCVYLEDLNLEVHGFSYHTTEIHEHRLEEVAAPEDDRIHILMAHGGDSNHLPFDVRELPQGFAYLALGHIHKPDILSENKAAFPGSPEPLDRTEYGQHGMIVGEISMVSKEVTSLTFIPLSKIQYIPLVIHVTPATTNMELSEKLKAEVAKRGREHIYRFRIRGMRDPDIIFSLDGVTSDLRVTDFVDESEPQYNFSALFEEHPGDMIGFYIQALQKDDMSPLEKKALYYGIDALLQTTDERS